MHARPPLENGFPPAPDVEPKIERPERPRMGGVFPGPASRATVTPPGPNETTSWPASPPDAEQGRFDQFKPDSEAAAKPEQPTVRMLPILLSVIIGAALVVGLAIGVVWLISQGTDSGGFSVSAGDCVKRSGDAAIKASCGDAGAFEVVSIADTKEQCADPGQPYVLNPTKDGKTQVLCLKPRS
jgi:collagen type III alpha